MTLQETDSGAAFLNAAGEAVFHLGSLFAVDANGVPTDDLTYTFQTVKNNIIGVTVTLDPEYLAAADRAFPVVIDPTVTVVISSSSTADACVCEKYPTTNYYMAAQLRTGYDTDYQRRRSYIRFSIPDSIEVGSVISAYLDVEKLSGVAPTMRAYRVTGSWSSSSITWSNKPGYTTTHQSTQSAQLSSGSSWYRMDVTSIVNSWVNGYYINYGFALVDNVENDPNHWTTLYSSDANSPHKPELHINYSESDEIPVVPPPSISLNYSKFSIEVGSSQLIAATVYPTNASVSWSSSNTSVATVSSSGRVTPRYPGKTTITASISGASAQCEVTVIPQGGYKYDIAVSNYYDSAFSLRYPAETSILTEANNIAASRLASIFALDITSYYYPYESKADICKIERYGSVTASNLDDQNCSHLIKCNSSGSLRTKLVNDGKGGSNLRSSVLWTGHTMNDINGDVSNSDDFTRSVVLTIPYIGDYNNDFLHELSHQMDAYDHYCKGVGVLGVCLNLHCDKCYKGYNQTRQCLMGYILVVEETSDQSLYCSDCIQVIGEHLEDHH